jgi:mannose-6-phosphate isomerase-like protein (cupin superfamily)
MSANGQLNIHSFRNPHSHQIQSVSLFRHDELHAQMVVVPPGENIGDHIHGDQDELFDVIEGQGVFTVGELEFAGLPGKCVFVEAGTPHSLQNPYDEPWVLRVTYHERLGLRHIGRLINRTIRRKFHLPA